MHQNANHNIKPKLLVSLSSHGFGHLAQVAPVIAATQRLIDQGLAPAFDLTVRTTLAHSQLKSRIVRSFQYDKGCDDIGMLMHDALTVDLNRSLLAYATLHRQWQRCIDNLAQHLYAHHYSGVLTNTPYLTLAAAHAAGIPAMAICSLNWADILEGCVRQDKESLAHANISKPEFSAMLQQIRDAYGLATTVVRPAPFMGQPARQPLDIEPIAPPPQLSNRAALIDQIAIKLPNPWVVLVSMGGMALELQPSQWPTSLLGRSVIYLTHAGLAQVDKPAKQLPHVMSYESLGMRFTEIMASCDLVLTKPGYGMFVETRTHGKPMLYVARDQWPETDYLVQWANTNTHASQLTPTQLATGQFVAEMTDVLTAPAMTPVNFSGADVAARTWMNTMFGYGQGSQG
ncbi:MAG TPA: hypothetical protein VIC30_09990 [Orrella sp.]